MSRRVFVVGPFLLGISIAEVLKVNAKSVKEIINVILRNLLQKGYQAVTMHIIDMKCASKV
jgi:hypothetical protein